MSALVKKLKSANVRHKGDGTGAVTRTAESKLRESLSFKDLGVLGDGVANDSPAVQAAMTANQSVRLVFTPGTYKLDTPTNGNGTQGVEVMEGAVFTGAGGVYNVTKFSRSDGVSVHERSGVRGPFGTVGHVGEYQNQSANGGMGLRTNYRQSETQTSGFSIGHGIVASFPTVTGGQGLASWLVAASPTTDTTPFGIFGQEVNPINRTSDSGYAKKRGNLERWSGGIQIVPEGLDLVSPGSPAIGNNVTYAVAVTKSGARGAGGSYARSHNGLLIEASAITAGGRGALISGDDLGEALPAIGVEIDQSWGTGISTRDATFTGNEAIQLGNNHKIVFGDPAGATFVPSVSGNSGLMSVGFSDGEVARLIRGAANSVNYLVLRGNATTGNPALEVAGADAVIGLTLGSKGAGSSIRFSPNGLTSFRVDSVPNQVNYGQIFGGAANSPVTFGAIGVDTNIDIAFQPKGTGAVRLGAWTTSGDVSVNGYITVKDSAGNVRKLATIA